MGVMWRRGICDGSCTGFFDSGENGEQSSQTSWSGTRPGHIVSFAIKQIFNPRGTSRRSFFLRVKNTPAAAERTVRRALP